MPLDPVAADPAARELQRRRLDDATAHLEPPLAVVDLDAFDANAADLVRRAHSRPVRVASKSLRCRALVERALATPGFAGVMAYSLREALWLVGAGVGTDVLVAYPTADRQALRRLAADPGALAAVTLVVDSVEQLDLIDRTAPPADRAAPLRLCVELDTAWRPRLGIRVGARRSPLTTPEDVGALTEEALRRDGYAVVGLLAYEAHIAGVADSPANPLAAQAIRRMQGTARRELAPRRAAAVAAVRRAVEAGGGRLELVDGGGTGSVHTTSTEPDVTEVAAGSGLLCPTLFDSYRGLTSRPAAYFALPVVRRPGPGVVTVQGGGYPASGAAGRDRLPAPWLPAGLRLDRLEGAGEVQTPLLGAAADRLGIGDRVWFRHAKSGELSERFDVLHLVRGEAVEATVPTYRGEGHAFG